MAGIILNQVQTGVRIISLGFMARWNQAFEFIHHHANHLASYSSWELARKVTLGVLVEGALLLQGCTGPEGAVYSVSGFRINPYTLPPGTPIIWSVESKDHVVYNWMDDWVNPYPPGESTPRWGGVLVGILPNPDGTYTFMLQQKTTDIGRSGGAPSTNWSVHPVIFDPRKTAKENRLFVSQLHAEDIQIDREAVAQVYRENMHVPVPFEVVPPGTPYTIGQ